MVQFGRMLVVVPAILSFIGALFVNTALAASANDVFVTDHGTRRVLNSPEVIWR